MQSVSDERIVELIIDCERGYPGCDVLDDVITALRELQRWRKAMPKKSRLPGQHPNYRLGWNACIEAIERAVTPQVLKPDVSAEKPDECEKCHGAGWLYPHEVGDHVTDQRYTCDECGGTGAKAVKE